MFELKKKFDFIFQFQFMERKERKKYQQHFLVKLPGLCAPLLWDASQLSSCIRSLDSAEEIRLTLECKNVLCLLRTGSRTTPCTRTSSGHARSGPPRSSLVNKNPIFTFRFQWRKMFCQKKPLNLIISQLKHFLTEFNVAVHDPWHEPRVDRFAVSLSLDQFENSVCDLGRVIRQMSKAVATHQNTDRIK